MDWKDIAGTVGKVAGAVGPLLGGPVGLAVSIGSQIAGALGVGDSPEAVMTELQNNPDAALKLQQWAHEERQQIRDNQIRLQELAHEQEKARLADVQNARAEHKDHWMPSLLTIALFVLFSGVCIALFSLGIPEGNRDLIVYLAGQVTGFMATCLAFWMGASKQQTPPNALQGSVQAKDRKVALWK